MVKLKRIDYRHYICVVLALGLVVFGVFLFRSSFLRLFEAFGDLWRSICFYFSEFFSFFGVRLNVSAPPVQDASDITSGVVFEILPSDFGSFGSDLGRFFGLFSD